VSDVLSRPRFFREEDGDLDVLRSQRVSILGYGNQGRAQALNLRDSGVPVRIGLRADSPSIERVRKDELEPNGLAEAVRFSDFVMVLVPDEGQEQLFQEVIRAELTSGMTLGFSHGFALRFSGISTPADVNVVLVAPKGPGSALRANFLKGGGLPAFIGVENDATGQALALALAYAKGIGCLRSGAMEVSAAMEAEADLFGEQSVLCGGISSLAEAAFEILVEAGFPPELAYVECVQEIKAMVDRIFELGPDEMWEGASGTARYGGLSRGPRLITSEFREQLRSILEEIQSGRFAKEWLNAARQEGFSWEDLRPSGRPIDEAGRVVRNQLKWSPPDDDS
jgi:ketol-acid reductoisomerase